MREPQIRPVFTVDQRYPALLKNLSEPPTLLWERGAGLKPDAIYLAVVGSRRVPEEAKAELRRFLYDLFKIYNQMIVISGLALGMDTVAHTFSLGAEVPTVAVLPTAINRVYPPENYGLAKKIWEHPKVGNAVISEYSPVQPQDKGTFEPKRRNRIVAGASKVLLAAGIPDEASGTLNTVRWARNPQESNHGRPLFFLKDTVSLKVRSILLGYGAQEISEAQPLAEALLQT